MDYEKFKKDYGDFLDGDDAIKSFRGSSMKNTFRLENKHASNDDWLQLSDYLRAVPDRVNSPAHYTAGSQEAIDTIEEAIESAPSVPAGFLQAQVLKYLLRVWLKDNPLEDLKKAQWYLNRLVSKLSSAEEQ